MAKKLEFSLSLTALACLSAACVATPDTSASLVNFSDVSATKSIVIVSTGAEKSCFSNGSFVKLTKHGVEFDKYGGEEVVLFPVDDFRASESDYTTHFGQLNVVQLEPGKYYLAPWKQPKIYVEYLNPTKFEFEIKPGTVLYLGEYFGIDVCNYDRASVFEMRDQRQRDLDLVAKQNSGFDTSKVEFLSESEFEALSETKDTQE
jgi:hypothetical protein